jgi:hypothetical protein
MATLAWLLKPLCCCCCCCCSWWIVTHGIASTNWYLNYQLAFEVLVFPWKSNEMKKCNFRFCDLKNSDVSTVVRKCTYGDYFLIMQMAKHMESYNFTELIFEIREELEFDKNA